MKQMRMHPTPRTLCGERGYSLIELSVAMVIAVFLLGGLFTILQGTRHTSTDQSALSELQDNERLAMSMITDVIQSAGYFPNAPVNTLEQALLVDGARFPTAGQSISGSPNGAQGDNLVVRFQTAGKDGVLNCVGKSNPNVDLTPAGYVVYVNTFQVNTSNQLTCQPNTGIAAVPLVNNVQRLEILYGVNSSATAANSNCPADTYIATAAMTTLNWTNVCTIMVKITFINPLYQPVSTIPPTPGQPRTVTFRRVIGLMGKSGVDVVNFT
jgi:type IV pilus assembly protein PilW